jgi:hypothetical protein
VIRGSLGTLGVVANATDPFDTPKRVIVRKVVNPIDGLSHSKSIIDRRTPFANSVPPFAFNLIYGYRLVFANNFRTYRSNRSFPV